jgi:CheY-like chemotaxis protein
MGTLHGFEILLIEDAADLGSQIRRVLETHGATVSEARTARSGLVASIEVFPHLIVCDLGLVGAGGFQFLTELKRTPELAKVPVLALSGSGDKASILRAMSLGASSCLLKPVQANMLIQRVEKLLSDSAFGKMSFTVPERRHAQVTVPMEIIRVGEGGFTIEAPVSLGPELAVRLDSPLLQQLGCADVITRTTAQSARPVEEGGFINEINLLGVAPKVAKAIRTFLRGRPAEETSL